MSFPKFQRTVTNNSGDVISGATVTVYEQATGLTATIYSDRSGSAQKTNPFTTGSDGLIEFFALNGEYRISVVSGFGSVEWEYVQLGGSAAITDSGNELLETPTNTDLLDRVKSVDSIASLEGFVGVDGQQVSVNSWHAGLNKGGGEFYFDDSRPKSDHDGGIVFSPTVPWTTNVADYLSGTGETDPSGAGCWIRSTNGVLGIFDFGCYTDGLTDSSDSFEALINSDLDVVDDSVAILVLSRRVSSTKLRITAKNLKLISTSTTDGRGVSISSATKVLVNGVTFEPAGAADQALAIINSSKIKIENCTFDHANVVNTLSGFAGGLYLANCNRVRIFDNDFMNGWRDHNFDAGNIGGNNLFRSLNISNLGQYDILIRGNTFKNVWSGAYVSNTNNLRFRDNEVEETADTAFFDRCTGMVTKKKRFIDNNFKDIGKAAIKTLDTNNDIDTIWAEDSIVRGNIVEDWGVRVGSECILAARNISGSYSRSSVKFKRLKIVENIFTQTNAGDTQNCLNIVNGDDVLIQGNTIKPNDSAGDLQLLTQWCSNVKVLDNTIEIAGNLTLAYGAEGRHTVKGNTITSGNRLLIDSDVAGVDMNWLINDNTIINTNPVVTNYFGISTLAVTTGFSFQAVGNTFKTEINYIDSNSSTGKSIFGMPSDDYYMIDSNMVEFADRKAMQKMVAGDILYPVYFRGLPGAAKNNGTGPITYKATTSRTSDTFTLTQT